MFSTKGMAILTILATFCFAALVVLQIMEFMHYRAEPSVWPPPPAVVR